MGSRLKFNLFAALAALVSAACLSGQATAAVITFDQSALLDMQIMDVTIDGSSVALSNYSGYNVTVANPMTAAPTYPDGQTPMSGSAGTNGSWNAGFNATVFTLFGLDASGIASHFGSNNLTGATTLMVNAFNDNDDIWSYGLWIKTEADGVKKSSITQINGQTAGSPKNAQLAYDLSSLDLSNVVAMGVFVGATLSGDDYPSSGDGHHSSWSKVPEPGTMAIWGGLGLFGLIAARRRKKR